MKIKTISIALLTLILFGCGNKNKETLSVENEGMQHDEFLISDEAMDEVIENIASPIEVAALLNELEIPFSISYLAETEKMSNYATNFDMAYNLGILSCDLGYLNMYDKTRTAINYLSTINKLTDALDVGQFFDFVLMKRLATSENNLDSLLFTSMNSFNNMDEYLRETNRSDLSSLMVAGVWMEGLYLSTQVYKKSNVDQIRSVIGEQKLILNDLLIILENYKDRDGFDVLLKDYHSLKGIFDEVKISYELGEPETVEIDGMLMVIQNETSTIEMSDETLEKIIEAAETIRNKQLSN